MGFYTISQQMLNTAFTTNGDKAYTTTGSACLDYFALIGGKRGYYDDALNLFMKAYYENPQLAIKILFYARDIRTGLGERNIFRYTLNAIAGMYPELAVQLIEYVPVYGRYDDLLVLLNTPVKEELIKYISNVLNEDLEKYFLPEVMEKYVGKEYGMPIYQEGAYFFAMHMAGLNKVESYRFMKILYKGKMKDDKIPYWREKFINGCLPKIKHKEYTIELENGVTTNYHRIVSVNQIINEQ